LSHKGLTYSVILTLLTLILLAANLLLGTVHIPALAVIDILMGNGSEQDSWRYIVLESRLPQALTALFTGASLAVSGLLLQTAFHNPLAGPSILGIQSGASLGVALVMLGMGGTLSTAFLTMGGYLAIILAAFIGAIAVTLLIFFFSTFVRSSVMLLILGMMVGYIASSVIALLNFSATAEGVKSYMVWGLGNFSNVSLAQLPLFCIVSATGLFLSALMVKPLNIILLGANYAANLGVNVSRLRNNLLLVTGLLTAVTAAFCGPIAFLGLAVPHIARLLLKTANHKSLLPVTLLCGSVVALLCNIICTLPGDAGILPLNAVTPIICAPIIIYVVIKGKGE
jgi:iron complex transport system permease protein